MKLRTAPRACGARAFARVRAPQAEVLPGGHRVRWLLSRRSVLGDGQIGGGQPIVLTRSMARPRVSRRWSRVSPAG